MITKQITSFLFFIILSNTFFSQNAEQKLFNKYLEESEKKEYTKALTVLEKFIKKYPESKNISEIYYNKGLMHTELNKFENAIEDYTIAFNKDSSFGEAIRLRGNIKLKMNKENEALEDFNLVLKMFPSFGDAYYDKGLMLKKQNKQSEACQNFESALQHGVFEAENALKENCDSNSITMQKFYLKILTDKATDSLYGFSENYPIKVGKPVSRQRTYLSFLRDSKGNKINYIRSGSCCPYPSKNGLVFGMAMCDKYKIELDGKTKILYISFYDYEEPKIPLGFFTEADFKK